MRGVKAMKVGILVAMFAALSPLLSYAANEQSLPTGAGIGGGGRRPRVSAAAAVATALPAPTGGQALPDGPLVPQGPLHYAVRRGDSLWQIARYYGLSVDVLAPAPTVSTAARCCERAWTW